MLLLFGVGGIMVFALPKLIGMMDPEAMEEMKRNQADINVRTLVQLLRVVITDRTRRNPWRVCSGEI